jgi:hypothetical protein
MQVTKGGKLMPFFYNSSSGSTVEEAGVLGFLGTLQTNFGIGWHEYASYDDVLAAVKAHPGWPAPTGQFTRRAVSNTLGADVPGAKQVGDISGGLAGVDAFLSEVSSASLWVRVGEVIAGLILLGIGLNAMLKGRPMSIITNTAGLAAKAVPA